MKLPYAKQWINQQDIDAAVRTLGSDRITQGPALDDFEKKLANYCGARYAVAVSNGTAALHLASLALGLKKGCEVITTPISFLATSNAVLYANAKPVFADVDAQTVNLSPEEVVKKINKNTAAIYPVHFGGLPCDMEALHAIAKKYRLFVVEDASHALGAKYRSGNSWVKVGSCRHSDLTVFSFHPVKHITTGEGGALTTNNPKLYESLKLLRNHGMFRSSQLSKNTAPGITKCTSLDLIIA